MRKKVFCYGDSNTYGYDPVTGLRHEENVRWTGRLQKMLGEAYEVVEQGCNGRTTIFPEPGAEWKSGRYALKVCLNTYKPIEYMILMLGSNDLKDYYHASAADIADGIEQLLVETKTFLQEKVGMIPQILLISPIEIGEKITETPFGDHFKEDARPRSLELAGLYEKIARRQGCHFLNAAAYAKPSKEDCLHMMPEEHARLADAIYAAFLKMQENLQDRS